MGRETSIGEIAFMSEIYVLNQVVNCAEKRSTLRYFTFEIVGRAHLDVWFGLIMIWSDDDLFNKQTNKSYIGILR